jgi:hypothetical protein
LLSLDRMRRGVHIAIALLAIILMAKPFDCFAGGAWTTKDMDCCKKGKCGPRADADECCKATVPGGNQFLGAKPADLSGPVAEPASAYELQPGSPLFFESFFVVHSPPCSPPDLRLTLPLLI